MSKNTDLRPSKKFKIHGIKLNPLDWIFLVVGIVTSIATVITDHDHSPIYIAASLIALNCAIIGTIFTIKGRRENFIFAFINALTFCYVAWSSQFYGSAIANLSFYAHCAIIGYYSWSKHSRSNREVIARKLTLRQSIIATIVFIVSTILLDFILGIAGGHSTFLDSSSNILVVFASILAVLRYREQWLVWFVSDVLQLAMWTATNDPAILVLRIFFVVSSIYGYYNWRKLVQSTPKNHPTKS